MQLINLLISLFTLVSLTFALPTAPTEVSQVMVEVRDMDGQLFNETELQPRQGPGLFSDWLSMTIPTKS
jgi:hypothetical protein